MTDDTISGVLVSPVNAETLVRRGGITNDHLIAYSLSNISAKNYRNRLMCVEVIVCYISVVFIETQYRSSLLSVNFSEHTAFVHRVHIVGCGKGNIIPH